MCPNRSEASDQVKDRPSMADNVTPDFPSVEPTTKESVKSDTDVLQHPVQHVLEMHCSSFLEMARPTYPMTQTRTSKM